MPAPEPGQHRDAAHRGVARDRDDRHADDVRLDPVPGREARVAAGDPQLGHARPAGREQLELVADRERDALEHRARQDRPVVTQREAGERGAQVGIGPLAVGQHR